MSKKNKPILSNGTLATIAIIAIWLLVALALGLLWHLIPV